MLRRVIATPGRVRDLVVAVPDAVGTALGLPGRASALLEDTRSLVSEVRDVATRADSLVAAAEDTQATAARVVDDCAAQLERTREMVASLSGPVSDAGPTVDRAVHAFTPSHVDDTAQLLDLVPELLDLVLPALRGLAELSPGMAQLAERLDNIAHIVEGVPGAKALKRRGTQRIESEQQ